MVKRAFAAIALVAVVTLLAGACGDDLVFPGKAAATPTQTQTASATETVGAGTPTPTQTVSPI